MKINIHELKKKSEMVMDWVQPITLKGVNPLHPSLDCDAHVEGTVTKVGNRYVVKGIASTVVKLLCDRCLEEFDCSIEAEIYQRYSTDPNEDDEEVLPISGFEIDLEDIITEAVVLNVPMKWLHDSNCKGICKVCGINLNKQSCRCDAQEIDPRLEGLRNLFHPQSEE